MKHLFCGFVALCGGGIAWFLGGFDGFLNALVIFMVLDYLSGVMCALYEKKLSSEIGFRGIFKKVMILVLVGIGASLDRITGADGIIRAMVIFFYLGNEGLSLLENAGRLKLPIPLALQNALIQIKKKSGDSKSSADEKGTEDE